jgi:hypothetical protein
LLTCSTTFRAADKSLFTVGEEPDHIGRQHDRRSLTRTRNSGPLLQILVARVEVDHLPANDCPEARLA